MPEEGNLTPAPEPSPNPPAPEPPPEPLLSKPDGDGGAPPNPPNPEPNKGTEQDPNKPVVPEKYEFAAPEGTTLDQAVMDKFTPLFKEAGMSQEMAQKLVNEYAAHVGDIAKGQQEAWVKQQSDWAAEFKADKDFGGDKAEVSLRHAETAWRHFATPEDIKTVHSLGFANFPPLVRILSRVGAQMGEGSLVLGESAAAKEGNTFLPGSKRI